MRCLIIIPAFNEEVNLLSLIDKIKVSCPKFDYVIVNDCSTDNTEQICKENNLNYLSLPINLGIGGTVQCGYLYALKNDYDVAIQIDGDGQHDPSFIMELMQPVLERKADMVIGSRFITKEGFQTTLMRRIGINLIRSVIKLCTGKSITDTTSGFRIVNRNLIKIFSNEYAQDYPEPESILTAVLNGYSVLEMPVVMNERAGGSSSINRLRSVYYMLKVPLALIIYRLSISRRKIEAS